MKCQHNLALSTASDLGSGTDVAARLAARLIARGHEMIAEIPAHNKAVLVIIGCYLLIGTWYSLAIPVGEAVDEVPHFFYVCYVKEHWSLPVQPWRENGRPLIVSMGHHPPLYYVLGAVLIAPIDTSDASSAFIANPHFVWQPNYGGNGWNVFLHPPEQGSPTKAP